MLATCLIKKTATVIGARIRGIELDGAFQIGKCIRGAARQAIDLCTPDIGRVVVWIERDRLIVVRKRLLVVARVAMDQCTVGIGVGRAGLSEIALSKSFRAS